ncbi:MAG: hypothetical protein AB1782_10360 [Cyanobacteriota bacterium]
MKKYSGSGLSQYSIIIALVALALVPVFFILGKSLFRHFEYFYNTIKQKDSFVSNSLTTEQNSSTIPVNTQNNTIPTVNNNVPLSNNTTTSTSPNNVQNTSSNTTVYQEPYEFVENPKVNCSGSNCTLDFGNFTLKGVPSDFGEFIQSAGTSGATDKIATLIEQIKLGLTDPAEEPIKNYLDELVKTIGTGNATSTQLAMNMAIYECMAGGSCNDIVQSPTVNNMYWHERYNGYTFSLPPISTQADMMTMYLNNGGDKYVNDIFDKFVNVCGNVTNNSTGKDYSQYIATVNMLKNQALEVREQFFEQVKDTSISPPQLLDPTKINIDNVKNNVASNTEDFIAKVIKDSK